jgi:hypothetical protein
MMIATFRLPRARTMTALVFVSGACLALAAPAASAAAVPQITPPPNAQAVCMDAARTGYSWTEEAVSADQAGQAATAASDDASAITAINPVTSDCYFVNPTNIYYEILNASEELQSAQSANSTGGTLSALSTEQSVATVLYNVFLTLFNQGPQ